MSRGVATLWEAILIQHSIKAGADFPRAHAPAFVPPQKKAIMNERRRRMRMMMKCKLFKEPARVGVFLCAGSFG